MKTQQFAGLSNQGATCYMNSLLQTLFMTPEFTQRLFQWQYDQQVPEQDCIPYQLQLLFAKLLLREKPYFETLGLTKSFQWNIRETLQQHDVQEFCRVLFDAIEQSFKDTDQEKLVTELYEGLYVDYVKCLECQHESTKQDKFLDLSLTVKDPLRAVCIDSVESALRYYLKQEHLIGENQYFCEHCGGLQDAIKGLKFEKLPYILVFQLKRFDLDYTTLQRKKLNDQVTFPVILNMNPFLGSCSFSEGVIESTESIVMPASYTPSFEYPPDIDTRVLQLVTKMDTIGVNPDKDKSAMRPDLVVERKMAREAALARKVELTVKAEKFMKDGPEVYELFSVMIHSGSAMGGHYSAYIKDFTTNQWFSFNDSFVREIDESELSNTFGGGFDRWNYGSNAYLLMYRKITPQNLMNVNPDSIPRYLRDELDREKQEKLRLKKEKEEKLMQTDIKIYFQGDSLTFTVRRDSTLESLKEHARKAFDIQSSPRDFRLRRYYHTYDRYLETFTGKEHMTLEALQISIFKTLVVEEKSPEEEFEDYNPNYISILVCHWRDEFAEESQTTLDMKFKKNKRVMVPNRGVMEDLVSKLERVYSLNRQEMLLFKRSLILSIRQLEPVDVLSSSQQLLHHMRIFDTSSLLLERKTEGSRWLEELERDKRRIQIKYNNPHLAVVGESSYSNSIVLNKDSQLGALKSLLSERVGVPMSELVIRKSSHQGSELKDMRISLASTGLICNPKVHLEKGIPCKPGECKLEISLAILSKASDSAIYSFYPLFTAPCKVSSRVSDLKQEIILSARMLYPSIDINSHLVVLREKNNQNLTKVLRNGEKLDEHRVFENKAFAIQESHSLLDVPEDHIVVVIRKWNPSSWNLSLPQEIHVPRACGMNILRKAISNNTGIPEAFVLASIIIFLPHFSRLDLQTERWFDLNSSASIRGPPFYINIDGNVLFVRNSQKKIRNPTSQEKELYSIKKEVTSFYSSREKSVKITVKK